MKLQRVIVMVGVCGVFASVPATSSAQQTSESAEAVQKGKGSPKQTPKARVWTNDNLPTSPSVSVVGETSQQGTVAGGAATEVAQSASPDNTGVLTTERDKATTQLAQAKKDLKNAKTDLDLAQRAYKLDSEQYYGTPDYAGDDQGKARLDSDKEEVSAKQQALDAAQKKVDDLQKQLDALTEKLKPTPDSSQPKG